MSFDQGAAAPAGTAKSTPKLSPKRMLVIIQSLEERPVLAYAAARAGIHRRTLEYWLKRSEAGDDGYDLEREGLLWRFHNHCEVAMGAQFDMLVAIVWHRAMGVVFKVDPFLVDLGYRGYEAYARDKNGDFIIEARGRPNGKMIRLFLEMVRPEKWGDPAKVKAPRRRFVLGIDDLCPEDNASRTDPVRQWKAWRRKIRDAKD
jgi:hypothetical protein